MSDDADATYRLTLTDNILSHLPALPRLLHDQDDSTKNMEVDALVASGDCFVTLATSLDDVTKLLDAKDSPALPQIENIIKLLLHLQRHYQISRKRSEYRQ